MANDSRIGSVLKRADKTQSADVIQLHKKPSFDALADAIKDAQNDCTRANALLMRLNATYEDGRASIQKEIDAATEKLRLAIEAYAARNRDELGLLTTEPDRKS